MTAAPPPPSDLPAGARLLVAARAGGVVVVGADPSALPAGVVDLLLGGHNVGAVVPGTGATRRDVAEAGGSAAAFAPGVLRDLALDPGADDDAEVAAAALRHVRGLGLRVLSEPAWALDPAAGGAPQAGHGIDLLVVTGFLDTEVSQMEDRLVFELVRSMREQVADGEISVLLTEGFASQRRVEQLRANGVEVVSAPLDLDGWLEARAGRFSHAVLTQTAVPSVGWDRLARSQPQAGRILYLSSLPFRGVSALAPLTPEVERPSLEAVRSAVETRILDLARTADAIWCSTDADALWVRGCQPGTPVFVVGAAVSLATEPVPLRERSGVVILADAGYDIVMANEDAAAAALEILVPPLRLSLPDLDVTVVADRPSPFLESEVVAAGARLVSGVTAEEAARRSRLLLDLHRYGTGGEATLRLALQTGTPFVAHPAAIGRFQPDAVFDQSPADSAMAEMGAVACYGSPEDIVYRARALLEDDERWYRVRDLLQRVVSLGFGAGHAALSLRGALAAAGIEATMPAGRWIDVPEAKDQRGPYHPVPVPLRPAGTPEPTRPAGELPADQDGRYQLWAEHGGPTEAVLASIADEVARLDSAPTISVVVPVYNPPGEVLQAAVRSVQDQIYPGWQLVLADDGSSLNETREVLAGLPDDPRIKLVRLPGRSGISGATNAAIEAADGDYVAFLDHDDLLKPHALAQVVRWLAADPSLDVVYSDEDKLAADGRLVQAHIKPDWSPNLLMAHNYVCHLLVVRRSLLSDVGGLRSGFDGSQDYDLVLRLAERTDRIAHIPEPLYSWRIIPGSAAELVEAKPYAIDAAKRALDEATVRRGTPADVTDSALLGIYRTRYHRSGEPRVAIVVPTKDALHLLEPCLRSVFERSTYRNFEVVVIDNQTTDPATLAYLARFPGRVLRYDHPFNYARMMNAAARTTECDAFIFLNNDTEVITPEWIEELLEHGMRKEVAAVGGRLYYGDGRVQHEGTVVGFGGWANNIDHGGYWARGEVVRDVSAVTGACMMMRSSVYWRLGGNDERMRVAYNDVDLCLRARQAGYQIVYTPYACLYHYEGASRAGREHDDDGPQFGIRWQPTQRVDPFYSPLFRPVHPPFVIRL